MLRIGFLASHGGSGMRAVLEAITEGRLPAAGGSVLVTNNSGAAAVAVAGAHGVPTCHLSAATHPDPESLDLAIADALSRHGTDVVLLSGYMKLLGPTTLTRFRDRILNTHPALLPNFGGKGMYGDRVHAAVLAAGVPTTGATIHLVDPVYDHGPVIRRREVPVLAGDDLAAVRDRVQAAERALIVEVLADIARGRLRIPPTAT